MKQLLQITPYLPPKISGVGDYALILAKGLRQHHGWQTTFLVAHPNQRQTEIEGFPILTLQNHNGRDLAAALQGYERILLQYVGYGYEKRGCPLWLLQGITEWKLSTPNHKLTTMFHELYAFGPPWRSSFWTTLLQRWICIRLAQLSSAAISNRQQAICELKNKSNTRCFYSPVFSNVGESTVFLPFKQRHAQLIIFGTNIITDLIEKKRLDQLIELIGRFEIESIIVIGSEKFCLKPLNTPTQIKSNLRPESIHQLMHLSQFGLMKYASGRLAKSGVFAAYCAHGLVPILLNKDATNEDRLQEGKHFLHINNLTNVAATSVEIIATSAWGWYQSHSIALTTKLYHNILAH